MGEATNRAVFLSYAREDIVATRRIAEALRSAGVEVWFDEDELRGGDSWDAKIKTQIKECALFMPVISASTQARAEGYFRLEWRLADRRTELIGKSKAFLVPVCIDGTREAHADVPDSFCAVQWTRLPAGETSAAFCARVKILLGGEVGSRSPSFAAETGRPSTAAAPAGRHRWKMVAAAVVLAAGALAFWQPWKRAEAPAAGSAKPGATPPFSQARQLAAKADALFDQDENVGRETLALAEKFCQQAIALDPNDAEIWAIFSRVCSHYIFQTLDRSQERRTQAENYATRAVRLAPDSFEARYAQAYFFRLTDATYPEAERMLRQLLQERPNDKRVWRTLGHTLRYATIFSGAMRGREAEAAECFRRAASLPGGDPLALHFLGTTLASLGKVAEGEKALEEALVLKPRSVTRVNRTNLLLRYGGDVRRAVQALAEVPVEFLREDYGAFIATQVWLCAREPDKAIEVLQALPRDYLEAVFDGPKGALIGQAHQMAGRVQAAEVEWRAALQLIERRLSEQPSNVRFLVWRATLLAWLGRRDDAGRALETTEQLGLSARDAHTAAIGALETGDTTKAIRLLKAALVAPTVATPAFTRINPLWDALRRDPRFEALVAEPGKPGTSAEQKSIAVLAFRNLSNEKDDDVFSDGISDELANVLGRVPGLRVVGSASAFSFKGKGASDQEIGQKLGVNYIVDGSVRKANGRVRITAKLINATDGFQVWASETLERELKDVWAVQDEIVGVIAQNLQLKLGGAARPAQSLNPEAHRLVLEGRHFWNLRTDDDLKRSKEKFTQALEIDPRFAAAHAGLADANVIIALYSLADGAKNVQDNLAQGRAAARRARVLDPSLSEPFGALAYAAAIEGDLPNAERNISQAIALNPNHATAHQWRGVFLARMGRLDEALQEFELGVQLDPLSFVHQWILGEGLMFGGRETQALALLERAETLRSTLFIPHLAERGLAQLKAGRPAEAIAAARTIRASWPTTPRWWADGYAVWILRQAGQGAEADAYASEILAKLPAESYQRGVVLAAADRFAEALPFLERTPQIARRILFWSAVFDRYRTDARFERLMATLGCLDDYKRARETLARIQQQPPAKK